MVRWMRTGQASGLKAREAMQWAKEVVEYVNTKHGGHLSVYYDAFGEYATIRWFVDEESLAVLEQKLGQLMTDQGYWQLVAKAKDLFIEGSIKDTVMRAI